MKASTLLAFLFVIASNTFGQTYQYYFGNIHSHSSYSDGNKDSATACKLPGDSYGFARNSYNFHFLGISEHNHGEAGMRLNDYAKGLYQADTANKNGEFVCMYGMEYGVISNGGHVVVYGIDSLIGWEEGNYSIYSPRSDYSSLWSIIASRPNAFATLAHPETGDYNNLSSASYNDTADIAICGSAVRSGAAFSITTDYSDGPPSTTYTGYFRRMLAAGYKLGPTIDHDNHYSTFGRTAQSRTVVLAQALHRDSITAAYKAMRFYASDDWNTKVDFTINAYPPGSTINTAVNPTINVSVIDPDIADTITSIKIHFGVPGSTTLSTVLTSVTNASSISYVHNLNTTSSYYYYVEITQADGDKIWTAPIWVNKAISILPLNFITLKGESKQQSIELKATLSQTGYTKVELEKSFRGSDFTVIKKLENANETTLSFVDNNPAYGHQYYRVKCVDKNGDASYSSITSVNYKDNRLQLVKVFPNPVTTTAKIFVETIVSKKALFKIYNAEGKLIEQSYYPLSSGRNVISKDIKSYSRGRYFLVIELGTAKVETSFIK